MKLVVVIPALDEEATIRGVIEAIPDEIPSFDEREVLVVDDGSRDATAEKARAAGAVVLSHHTNLGVGAAFHTGVEQALHRGADVIATLDADGQFDPRHLPQLVAPILEGRAGMVTASRFRDRSLTPEMRWTNRWGNRGMAWLVSFLVGRSFHDVSCGFRAYSREAALNLNLFGHFTYTQETFLDLTAKRIPIAEVPLRIRGKREVGTSRVARSLPRYAWLASRILLRSILDFQPLRVIGGISAVLLLPGMALLGFLVVHYLRFGVFTPYKAVGFAGGLLVSLGLLVLVSALIADMLLRIRWNQERILLLLKSQRSGSTAPGAGAVAGRDGVEEARTVAPDRRAG